MAVKTLAEIKDSPREERVALAQRWREEQLLSLCQALSVSAPGRVDYERKEDWRGGWYKVKVDGEFVTLDVEYGTVRNYSDTLTGKAHCMVRCGSGKTKTFPLGRGGFNTEGIVAEVLRQVDYTKRYEQELRERAAKNKRLDKEVARLKKKYKGDYDLGHSEYGDRLTLTFNRLPEGIEKVLALLKEGEELNEENP